MLQRWRSQLEQELRRQGLPQKQVERLVGELTDHALDLLSGDHGMDAKQEFESRLGSPEQLAMAAKSEYINSTFAARRPVLAFIGVPVVSMLGTVICVVVLSGLLCSFADKLSGGNLSVDTKNYFIQVGSMLVRFIPFLVSTWLVVRFGRRLESHTWSRIGLGIIVVAAFMFSSNVMPKVGETQGQWSLMFGVGANTNWNHLIQAFVPFAFGVWMIKGMSSLKSQTPSHVER